MPLPKPGETVQVHMDEGLRPMPEPTTPNPMDVVSKPSMYHGIPKDIAAMYEKIDENGGVDLPKYVFQLGAGATEASTLGLVEPGFEPETNGEAMFRYAGQVLGAGFVPVGPAVNVASKLTKGSTLAKMATGAAANIAATEIQTRGEASKERLMMDATLGAIFGKFYNSDRHWLNVPMGERKYMPRWSRSPDAREPNVYRPMSPEGYGSPNLDPMEAARSLESNLPPRRSPGPLALPDYTATRRPITPSRADFTSPELLPETPTDSLLRQAQQTLTGRPTDLPEFPGSAPTSVSRDIITRRGEMVSPLAIEDTRLFQRMGIKGQRGTTQQIEGAEAQRVLNKLSAHRDPGVREAAISAKTFLKHSDDFETSTLAKKLADVSRGIEHPDGDAINFALWENPREYIDRMPRSQLPTGITELTPFTRIPKMSFQDIQLQTGGRIQAFEHYWEGFQQRELAARQQGQVAVKLNDQLKGIRPQQARGLMEYFTHNDFNEKQVYRTVHMLTDDQIARGEKAYSELETVWNRNFPDTPFSKFMTEYIPTLRKGDPGAIDILKNDPAVKEMAERFALNHEFSFREGNFTKFAAQLNRSLSLKEHFDPFMKKVQSVIDDPSYPTEYKNYLAAWTRRARGTESQFAKKWNPTYKKMWERVGVSPEDKDVRDVIDNYIALTHTGLLGFRPGPILRNAFNALQTGSRVGYKWIWHGMRKAVTKEGFEQGRLAGMVDEASHDVEALRELAAPGPVTRGIRWGAAKGLKWYGFADDLNRTAVYIAMHDRFLDAAKKSGGNVEKLKRMSALDRFHPVTVEHVLETMKTSGLEKAAELAGVHAAQDTQWVYRTTARPPGLSGEVSRMFSQFGIWSLNYWEYTKQMMSPWSPIPFDARMRWMRDYALGNATVMGAMAATGAVAGLGYESFKAAAGWTGAAPLGYQGAPVKDFIVAVPGFLNDIQKGVIEQNAERVLNSPNWKRMKDAAMTVVPGYGLARDVMTSGGAVADFAESALPPLEKLRSNKDLPARSIEEEIFRIGTGIRVRE